MSFSPVNLSLHTIKKLTASWVCWLMIMLMLAPIGQHAVGAVLCIEADGTVTIEKATGFSCDAPATSIKPQQTDSIVSMDTQASSHCGTCIDVMLPGEADEDCASFILARTSTAQVDLPAAATLPSFARFTHVETPRLRPHPEDTSPSFSLLTPLRSVILLI